MMKNYYHIKNITRGWTKQPNAVLHDERLTSDAKVIIYELLSVSGEFHISESGIAGSVHLSLERVKKAVRLLKATGYIQLTRVKEGSRFGGCKWGISDSGGTFRELENHATGNQSPESQSSETAEEIGGVSSRLKTTRPENQSNENNSIYQITNNEEQKDEEQKDEEGIYEETKRESISPTLTSLFQTGESIISSGELNINQAFNRFCEVYPRLGDRDQARAAFLAIPDIESICWQIANSVEWFKKLKRWDDWQTCQKNKYCPQAVKFLTRGDWQEFLKSDSEMSFEERMDAIFPDEEDEYETN